MREYPSSRPFRGRIGRTFAQSEPWWPPRPTPPDGAPNVVVILLDDMGFSDVGCFGSEIETPAIDSLAAAGTRYTNFHATPVCAPTRASLLSGLNHHRAGFAMVSQPDSGFPARSSTFPPGTTTLAEVLRENGYATMAVGKWHLTPPAEGHAAGDRSMWPCRRGFDRYYGFLEGLTNQHHPHELFRDNTPVHVDRYADGYYLTDDLTDEALRMIRDVRANEPAKPFFLYFAHAAVHGPLMARREDVERFRGRYAAGWDEIRRQRFARQLELGLFPRDLRLPPPNEDVLAWDEQTPEDQALFSRMMEVYAGMVASVERSTARLLSLLDELGERENTLIAFMSDNGGTGEGGPRGMLHYWRDFPPRGARGEDEPPPDLEALGGPTSQMHYPSGWGMASNTPFRLYKASVFEGGVRVPLIVSWPACERRPGSVDDRWHYVTDLMPTVLERIGIPCPEHVQGESFASDAAPPRSGQYDEHMGNRSYWDDGWKVATRHRPQTPFDDAEWQLYHLDRDPTEIDDLAAAERDRVASLAAAWERAAATNDVFPLDEGVGLPRALRDPALPDVGDLTLRPGTPTVSHRRSAELVHFRSFSVDVDFAWTDGDEGILVAHGDQGCGYVVYVEQGRVQLAWNEYGRLHEAAGAALRPGAQHVELTVEVRADATCDAAIGDARVDGVRVLGGLSPFEGIDIGIDRRSPVSWPLYERHGTFPYSGRIDRVRYRPGELLSNAPQLQVERMREAGLRFQ
jgi:arylsulfatase